MTSDGTFSYSYDAENRLLAAYPLSPVVVSLAVENRDDHRHRRSRKIVKQYDGADWKTKETHTFVWDGNKVVLERVEFANGASRTFEYFWGSDKSGSEQGAGGVEGLLAVSMDGVFYIPCYDHNGNIALYVSETGSIAAQYVYDPYGNVEETYGNLAEAFSFGFSTKYHDRETGMVGYQRRFYRPDLGRWLNRDPIEEEGGENLYAFCGNNPILHYDINGESFWDDLIDSAKIVVGICGVVSGAALGAATSWTGAGAVGGFAMVAIGLDQVMEGVNSIYSRVSGGPATDTSPIKEFISQSSYAITGSQNSKLEQYAISAYSGVQLASSCYGGFVSLQTAIQAVRMTYVPAHTVRIMTIEKGFLRYSWELKAGYWKLSGGSDAAQAVFEISVDGMTYFEHDAENENVEVNSDVDY
jgi:RHS repeat-associated protein